MNTASVPHFTTDMNCLRSHPEPLDVERVSPFSRQSARSTMLMSNPLAAGTNSVRVSLGDESRVINHFPDYTGEKSTQLLLKPLELDAPPRLMSNSLQAKMTQVGKPKSKYRVKDYTLDSLSLQLKRDHRREDFVYDDDDDVFSAVVPYPHNVVNDDDDTEGGGGAGVAGIQGMPGVSTSLGELGGRFGEASGDVSVTSTLSSDIFKIDDVDAAISELAELYGINGMDQGYVPMSVARDASSMISMKEDRLMKRFTDYVLEYRATQARRQKRSAVITSTVPDLCEDIKPHLKKWFADHNIYAPNKPQTIKFLREHKSATSVHVSGLLYNDEDNPHTAQQINEMIGELDFPAGYFKLPLDQLQDYQPMEVAPRPHVTPSSLVVKPKVKQRYNEATIASVKAEHAAKIRIPKKFSTPPVTLQVDESDGDVKSTHSSFAARLSEDFVESAEAVEEVNHNQDATSQNSNLSHSKNLSTAKNL